MNLRDYANGKECQVRIPAVCNGDPATTVLAHLRMSGITGVGLKAPDILGAWSCSSCHDEVDRRTHHHDYETVRLSFLEAIMRTQAKLIEEGLVKW